MIDQTTLTLSFATASGQGVEIAVVPGSAGGRATIALSAPGDRVAATGDETELIYDLCDAFGADVADGWSTQLRTDDGEASFTMVDAAAGIARLTVLAEGVSVSAEFADDECQQVIELLQRYFAV